ncbi:MAG: fasciclin domain-containing protein [Candidatus Marinimicrobia bacterium]|jgi:uncharacterized surface protein with fasciclin (FAS1) repeats|nr:fasciclin domain-containing protein [Candidatus Neomarinimicrobiota bacterium]
MKGKSISFILIFFFTVAVLSIYLMRTNEKINNENKISTTDSDKIIAEGVNGQAFIEDSSEMNSVLHVAINSKDHSTLVLAVQAAELENSLVNAGPLTVFAPTNEAFDELPPNTVSSLLERENIDKLAFILKHHVTPGNYSKDFIKKFKKLGQASNENVPVEVKGDDVYIGGAKIIASVKASNGTVHIVDKVILP